MESELVNELIDSHLPSEQEQNQILEMSPRQELEFACKRQNANLVPIYDKSIYDCPKCNNSGFYFQVTTREIVNSKGQKELQDYLEATPCECSKIRETMKLLAKSGLTETMKKESFDNYKTISKWQEQVKDKALKYLQSETPCFYIGGFTGSGKTKICTCILNEFIKQKMSVRYIVWNDFMSEIMNDFDNIDTRIEEMQKVDVLYIDDLYKFEPKDFEKKVLFRIINYRTRIGLKTLISSELKLANTTATENEIYVNSDLVSIDLAVAGRIYESANKGEFIISIPNEPKYNMRFKEI